MAPVLECLILGDSIAVGVAQARPACAVSAQVGITSAGFLHSLFPTATKAAAHVVISLGVNDDAGADTPRNLRRLRQGITASRVTWLLPGLKAAVREHIRTVAAENRDQVVDTVSQVGPDRLHPGRDGYRRIALWTEQGGTPPAATPIAAPVAAPVAISAAAPGALRRLAFGPAIVAMPGSAMRPPVPLPMVQAPGAIYGAWPPARSAVSPYAAIPPRDYAFRALPRAVTN